MTINKPCGCIIIVENVNGISSVRCVKHLKRCKGCEIKKEELRLFLEELNKEGEG